MLEWNDLQRVCFWLSPAASTWSGVAERASRDIRATSALVARRRAISGLSDVWVEPMEPLPANLVRRDDGESDFSPNVSWRVVGAMQDVIFSHLHPITC